MIEIAVLEHRTLAIDRLTIGEGRTFLIGPNGSGKTTLLRLLAGLDLPEHGMILIDGASPRSVEIGWANEYPDRSLLFSRTRDEIASPLRFRDVNCNEIDDRVKKIATAFGISELLDRPVSELSGGERIITAIAAAVITRPLALVLDEYDSHLDIARCRQVSDTISEFGCRYIISCTQQMETAAIGDCVIALYGGKVTASGTPSMVFSHLERTAFYPHSWRGNP